MIQTAIRIGRTYAIGRCDDDDLQRSEINRVKVFDITIWITTLLIEINNKSRQHLTHHGHKTSGNTYPANLT